MRCAVAAILALAACGKGGDAKPEPLPGWSRLNGMLAKLEEPGYSDAIAAELKQNRRYGDRAEPPTFTAAASCAGDHIKAEYDTGTPSLVVTVTSTSGRMFPVELRLNDRVSATDATTWEKIDQLPQDATEGARFPVEAGKLPELFPAGQQVELTLDATVAVARIVGGIFTWDKRHRLRGWKLALPIPETVTLAALAEEGRRLGAEERYLKDLEYAIESSRDETHPEGRRALEAFDRRLADLNRRWRAHDQLPVRALGARMQLTPPATCKP